MSEHTKGPWEVRDVGDWSVDNDEVSSHSCAGVGAGPKMVALPVTTGWDETELDANARLIASAPELLEALTVMLGHMTGGMDGDWRDCDPVDLARAVIAKAKGQQ